MRVIRPLLRPDTFFSGSQPVLDGDGLVLRPWQGGDADAIARAYSDPAIEHWHMASLARHESRGWIDVRSRRWRDRVGADWAVAPADAPDTVLGRVAIHRFVLEQGLGEVSYWVLPDARGQHVAARSLAILCEWAFGVARMHRLELCHSVGNPASCGVAQRAGFALEGVKRAELRHEDGWHDMHLHARLEGDPAPVAG